MKKTLLILLFFLLTSCGNIKLSTLENELNKNCDLTCFIDKDIISNYQKNKKGDIININGFECTYYNSNSTCGDDKNGKPLCKGLKMIGWQCVKLN